jgi:putative membrane protein
VLETKMLGDKEKVINEESVLPWNFNGESYLLYAGLLMLAGFLLIIILEKVAEEKPEGNAANPNV